ncbi:MAG: hypothetical protein R6V01_04120 [Thermoplasmatota archaeon]
MKEVRFRFWFYLIYRFLLVVALVLSLLEGNLLNAGLALFTFIITLLPTIIERRFDVHYPTEFEIVTMVFIYLGLILGSIGQFYERFHWWDVMLHTISGILLGLIGLSLVYLLNRSSWEKIRLSRAFVALFAFCFALSLGTLWEIYEYTFDKLFDWNLQRSGLDDTMWDLIVDAIGAGSVSILGYLYLKGDIKLFERIEEWFVNRNPTRRGRKQDTEPLSQPEQDTP